MPVGCAYVMNYESTYIDVSYDIYIVGVVSPSHGVVANFAKKFALPITHPLD